jgi:hypothetical protein
MPVSEGGGHHRAAAAAGGARSSGEPLSVVVANEPRTYRDVMAAAFRSLRPHLEVTAVEPDELDVHLARHAPQVVVYSRASEAVQAGTFAWVLLYPDGANRATISIAGQRTSVADIQFEDLLGVLDQARELSGRTTSFSLGEHR